MTKIFYNYMVKFGRKFDNVINGSPIIKRNHLKIPSDLVWLLRNIVNHPCAQ